MTPDPRLQRLRDLGATIGADVYLGPEVYIEEWFAPLLTIEDGVVVSQGATLLLHDSSLNNVAGAPVRVGEVLLRERCYLGANVTVLCGLEVGRGSLIGAGSLVTRDVPAGVVAYGVPARPVGSVRHAAEHLGNRSSSAARSAFLDAPPWRERSDADHAALHRRIDEVIADLRGSHCGRPDYEEAGP